MQPSQIGSKVNAIIYAEIVHLFFYTVLQQQYPLPVHLYICIPNLKLNILFIIVKIYVSTWLIKLTTIKTPCYDSENM